MGASLVAGDEQRARERKLAFAGDRALAAEECADRRRVALLVIEQLLGAAAHKRLVRPVRPLAQERVDLLEAHVLGRQPDGGPLHQRAGGGVAHRAREGERLGRVAVAQQIERLLDRGGIVVLRRCRRGCAAASMAASKTVANSLGVISLGVMSLDGGRITPIAASYGPAGVKLQFP